MVELDYDQILEELTNLPKKPDADALPEILDRYLETVARNGDIVFPWSKVKPFMRRKLESVMDSFHRDNPLTETQMLVPNCKPFDYQDLKVEIMKSFDWFYAAPFTIQRLCELLVEPSKHYRRTDKLMRGIEKNVLVVSTVQPRMNKYATPETMEKQSNFKDFYPHFNSSPSHNNHSSTSSASSSTPPSGNIMNGSLDSTNNAQAHNSYDNSPSVYLNSGGHPMANSFYDQAPPPPQLNNHHHHLLETMNEPTQHSALHPHHAHPHANHHSPLPQHHHPQHSSPLAPLQQLDSFTNVFATTTSPTHHHLTHLSASYSIETSAHLTNGAAGGWPHDAALKSAAPTNPYDSLLHPSHGNDPLNDENENIVVDDDEEDEKEDDERRVAFNTGAGEKEGYFYNTDSSNSNSNTSDSSSYNSDNSNSPKEEVVGLRNDVPEAPQEPNSSSDETTGQLEHSIQDLTPKKRPSPTPPPESSSEAGQPEPESVSSEVEPPLTPKKLRVQAEELSGSAEPEESIQQEILVIRTESRDEEVTSESVIASSSNGEENSSSVSLSLSSDDAIPMDLNVDEANAAQQQESISVDPTSSSSNSKNDDIPMQSCAVNEESNSPDDDQVMDEPMDQE